MYQKITLVGNLGRDPETRCAPSGSRVCSLNVATNRKYKNSAGEPIEETVWFRVAVWGKHGEACQQYLHVGNQVLVEGRLAPDRKTGGPRAWKDDDGNPRASYDVTAETVRFLGRRTEQGDNQSDQVEGAPAPTEEEIPF